MADAKKIQLKIVSPEKVILEREIYQATLPVVGGIVTILPNHRSYIGALKTGEIILKDGAEEVDLAVTGGFVEFNKNVMTVLADNAQHGHEIDLKEAEEARKRAEEAMKQRHTMDDMEYATVAGELELALIHIKIARRHHARMGG